MHSFVKFLDEHISIDLKFWRPKNLKEIVSRDLNGYIVKVVLIEVCIREVNCLKFWKPFTFRCLALSAYVGLVPHQSQVYEAGAVFTQGANLNSLELREVETDQGLTVPREDGGEDWRTPSLYLLKPGYRPTKKFLPLIKKIVYMAYSGCLHFFENEIPGGF